MLSCMNFGRISGELLRDEPSVEAEARNPLKHEPMQ